MLVREAIEARLAEPELNEERGVRVRLPTSLQSDRTGVRTAMLRRLATSRLFAIGDRAGVLRTAQKRSGRPFRLDVRQRVIVKAWCLGMPAGARAEPRRWRSMWRI